MKKYTIGVVLATLIFAAMAFFGSGYLKRKVALYTGYSTICVDGVKYIQFTSGASVKYNLDGTIEKCSGY